MLYRKNITRPESLLRVVGGVALIAAGLWWLAASPLGLALAASGVGSILSGAFGYCPACAMVGRKPARRRSCKTLCCDKRLLRCQGHHRVQPRRRLGG